jgi:hypothetical protein
VILARLRKGYGGRSDLTKVDQKTNGYPPKEQMVILARLRKGYGGRSDLTKVDQKTNGYPPKEQMVILARGIHLFPFRTEKLSPSAPMVLPERVGE